MTREDITHIIEANGLYHGTVSIGIIMDMEHLERLVQIVENRIKDTIMDKLNRAAEMNGEEL